MHMIPLHCTLQHPHHRCLELSQSWPVATVPLQQLAAAMKLPATTPKVSSLQLLGELGLGDNNNDSNNNK